MTSEPTEYLRVSYSSMNVFASCPRKFEFDKLYPKRKRDGDNYAADVGKAMHAGYQHFLIHKDEQAAIFELMQQFPFELEFQQDNDYRGFEACLATFELMLRESKMDEYELAKIKRPDGTVVPAIEVPFEIRFKGITLPDGRGISFIGFIDAIMQSKWTQQFRTLDIKTTRLSIKDATPKFKFDTQQIPYGIVVDHVANGQVDDFEVYYLDCYIDLAEPRVGFYPFVKTRNDIQEWCLSKVLQIQQLQTFMTHQFFPRTDSGCLFYNSPCRYIEPCMSRDRESLENWFLMGEEAAGPDEFQPWIIADIEVQ